MAERVSRTSLNVAAHRARETERSGALFCDPYARRLAGPEGFAVAEEIARLSGLSWSDEVPSMFALRTRFFDDGVIHAATSNGVRQIVIVGAGMDTRAYRIDWPDGTHVYEVDRRAAFNHKDPILEAMDARPRCARHVVVADLRHDWCKHLLATGFAPDAPTAWTVEGLLYYLPEPDADRLIGDLTALCPRGSMLLADVAHPMMRDLPALQAWRDALLAMDEPFQFFTEDGTALLARHGWDVEACSIADVGRQLGIPIRAVGGLATRRLLSGRRV